MALIFGVTSGNTFHPSDPNKDPIIDGPAFVDFFINRVNTKLTQIPQNSIPGPNNQPANSLPNLDARIRFQVYTEPDNLTDIYGGLWFHDSEPPLITLSEYPGRVIDLIVVDELTSSGNMFIAGQAEGVGIGSSIRLRNLHFNFVNGADWNNEGLLHTFIHEAFHLFALHHSGHCDSVCFDIDPESECNSNDPSMPCDNDDRYNNGPCQSVPGSNNIMGNNTNGLALTPCQLIDIFCTFESNQPGYVNWGVGCEKISPPTYITEDNVVFNFPRSFHGDIVVKTGSVLVVKSILAMASGTSIIVERGARLIVKDGIITAICPEEKWNGIRVAGNVNVPHTPEMLELFGFQIPVHDLAPDGPGVVHVINSTISNAKTGISTKAPGLPWEDQKQRWGGLVSAIESSKFINNNRGVEFLKYLYPNLSEFEGCEFESKSGWAGVTIWDCTGITFDNCRFGNMGSTSDVGIRFFNADAKVQNGCRFHDLLYGMDCFSTSPLNTFITVGREEDEFKNEFENNKVHIFANTIDKLNVENSVFRRTSTSIPVSKGILIRNQSGFRIENSSFFNANIFLSSTGFGNNLIQGNSFTIENNAVVTQFGGIHFVGNNFSTDFRLNCFDCKVDVSLRKNGNGGVTLIKDQGSPGFPVFNLFTEEHTPYLDVYSLNTENESFFYFPPLDAITNAHPRLLPRCDFVSNDPACNFNNRYRNNPTFGIEPTKKEFHCYNEWDGLIIDEPNEYCISEHCLDSLKLIIETLKSTIDGSDKSNLLTALGSSATSDNTYQLLLSASPYLSDEVLISVIQNAFIEDWKRSDILFNNSPLTNQVMTEVQNLGDVNLFQQLFDEKEENPLSARKILEIEIDNKITEKNGILEALMYELLNNNQYATIESLLLEENTAKSAKQLFGLKMRQKDYVGAESVLASLPEETQDDIWFKDVQSINIAFETSIEEFELTEEEEAFLYMVAETETQSSSFAQALLGLLKNAIFYHSVETETQGIVIENNDANHNEIIFKNHLLVFPNPAKDYLEVVLPLVHQVANY